MKNKIVVQNTEVKLNSNDNNFISLTDIARYKDSKRSEREYKLEELVNDMKSDLKLMTKDQCLNPSSSFKSKETTKNHPNQELKPHNQGILL